MLGFELARGEVRRQIRLKVKAREHTFAKHVARDGCLRGRDAKALIEDTHKIAQTTSVPQQLARADVP